MGRSPRDFESRASTSFTTPAQGWMKLRKDLPLLPHLRKSVEINAQAGMRICRSGRNGLRGMDGGMPRISSCTNRPVKGPRRIPLR